VPWLYGKNDPILMRICCCGQFTELNAISVDDAMNKALLTKMDDLVHESRPVALSDFGEQWIDGSMGIHDKGNLLPFWDLKANVEEWLG
jgi:hypothetical protein